MDNLRPTLIRPVRIFLLGLCLCSLVAFLFAQNEHAESPLDVIRHAIVHLERENHIGSLNASLIPWDGAPSVITLAPFIRKRLTLRSVALSPQIPPPKIQPA